jgi:hypothetical protein
MASKRRLFGFFSTIAGAGDEWHQANSHGPIGHDSWNFHRGCGREGHDSTWMHRATGAVTATAENQLNS